MSSESGKQLSMEELRRLNMSRPLLPPTPPERHPTSEDWLELSTTLTAMGQILVEQNMTLEELSNRSYPWPTREQIENLLQEARAIHCLLEQAGKKKERRFSLPKFRLPQPTLAWLVVPAILLGLLALWYSWAALSNGLAALFP